MEHDQELTGLRKKGFHALSVLQYIILFLIAVATVIAMATEVKVMIDARHVSLADLLLMFIYLEVLAMVESYLSSGKLPVRMPLYIGIVALARYLILDMKNIDTWRMVAIAGTALILAVSVFVIRYGHIRYPYPRPRDMEP